MKAKVRIAALFSRSGSGWSQGPALAPPSPTRKAGGSAASAIRSRTAFGACFLALGALLLAAAPASAEVVHVLQPTSSFPFTGLSDPVGVAEDQSAHLIYVSDLSTGTVHKFSTAGKREGFSSLGSSELTVPSSPGLFEIGVDNSGGASAGDIYVPDSANHRVDKFNEKGEFLVRFGNEVNETAVETSGRESEEDVCPAPGHPADICQPGTSGDPTAVAVDSSGNVFVTENAAGVIDELSSEGTLLNTFGAGHLENLEAIAVGPAPEEDVYVGTYSEGLVEFEHSGACVNSCGVLYSGNVLGIGVDSHGNVFADSTHDVVSEYNSAGTFLEEFGEPSVFYGEPYGVAVDNTSEDVYVADPPLSVIKVFAPVPAYKLTVSVSGTGSGRVTSTPGRIFCGTESYETHCVEGIEEGAKVTLTAEPTGPAGHTKFTGWSGECSSVHGETCEVEMTAAKSVGATFEKLTFPEAETKAATEVMPTSAILNGTVKDEGVPLTECFFEYGETEAYGHTAACEHPDAEEVPVDLNPHAVHAKVTIPGPDHFRLVAANHNGSSIGFDMIVPIPVVEADTVHAVEGANGQVWVLGTLEPNAADTHYHFEFVTEQQFEESAWAEAVSTPSMDGGSGTGRDMLAVEAPTLQPETGYDFRAVAENSALSEPTYSATKTIPKPHPVEPAPTTCPNEEDRYGESARLPECRAYEQVTPENKEGSESIFGYGGGSNVTSAPSSDGNHFLITNTLAKWGKNVQASGSATYTFSHKPGGGWKMTPLTTQPESGIIANEMYEYYNEGFSQFLVNREWQTSFGTRSPDTEYALGPAGGPYKTVATEPTEIGHGYEGSWRGQSRDGRVAVIESPDHELIPGHPTQTTGGNKDLYASVNGNLEQVNVETNGAPIGTVGTCSAQLVEGREAGERGGDRNNAASGGAGIGSTNAISANGSRIFFYDSPGECAPGPGASQLAGPNLNLYMREPFAEKTVDIGPYTFEGANPEGTRLLLAKEIEGGAAAEWFTYDTETHATKRAFTVPADYNGPGLSGSAFVYHAMSEDGNDLYFTTTSALNHETVSGPSNLYRYDLENETLTFITFTGVEHGGPWSSPYTTTEKGEGFYWTQGFEYAGPGTPYDESYSYDGTEQVVLCVACNSPYNPQPKLPSTYIEEGGPDFLQAPLITPASANGNLVFFDTPSALLPNDINGEIDPSEFDEFSSAFSPSSDVYEWRRHGIDGCELRQGCLALITNGINGYKNMLLGTDPSGENVFIATESQLVAQDNDNQMDVYDVRVDGGYPAPDPLPLQCEGDACHNPTNPPNDPTPATSVHEGPGNEHVAPPVEKPHKKRHKKRRHAHRGRRNRGHGKGGHS